MDEEKKSESSWEEAERLGPYRIHEPVPQAGHGRGVLYRARHETSGETALLLKPAEQDAVALKDWRVRLTSSSSPGYIALEAVDSPWSVAPDKHSAEALVFLFEGVREGMRRMAQPLPASDAPRPGWRLGLSLLASVAAACLLLLTLLRLPPEAPPPNDPTPLAQAAPEPPSDEVPTDTLRPPTGSWIWGTEDGGVPVLARPFPSKPYKGQRRPPCKPHIEVEIMGACWVPHKLKAPCPEELYEHQGECYTASMASPPLPRSLGQ